MSTDDVPLGINTATGAVAATAGVTVAGLLPLPGPQRVLLVAAVVGAVGVAVAHLAAAVVTAVLAFALFDGFVEDRSGTLGWHPGDLATVAVLLGAAVLGAGLGLLRRRHRQRRRHRALELWANEGCVRPAGEGAPLRHGVGR